MKPSLKMLIFFPLPILVVIGWVEYTLSENRRELFSKYYQGKKEKFEAQLSEIQVLSLGSSHAVHAIDANYFPKRTFNLADYSQSLIIDQQLLEKYAGRMQKLKTVLLTVSYFTPFYKLSNTAEFWKNFWYRRVYGIKGDLEFKSSLDIRNFSFYHLIGKELSESFIKQKLGLSQARVNQTQESATKGTEIKAGKSRIDTHHEMMREEYFHENAEALRKIVAIAKAKNLEVVFFTSPVQKFYLREEKSKYLDKMKELLVTLVTSAPQNVRYIDYTGNSLFTESDFQDADHLNTQGAQKIAQTLTHLED